MTPQSHTCVPASSRVSSPAVHKNHSHAHSALNATIQTTHRSGKYIAPNIQTPQAHQPNSSASHPFQMQQLHARPTTTIHATQSITSRCRKLQQAPANSACTYISSRDHHNSRAQPLHDNRRCSTCVRSISKLRVAQGVTCTSRCRHKHVPHPNIP